MAGQWISAATARQIVGEHGDFSQAEMRICQRAHAGLITARARLIRLQGKDEATRLLQRGFWWADGHEALEQDWAAGDFSTWIDSKFHVEAFGVEFDLSGILELIPPELRGGVAARFSVVSNGAWVCAKDAVTMISPKSLAQFGELERKLMEAARLGFVACRAVEALGADHGFQNWRWREREWDVPLWFWEHYTAPETSSRNFAGNTARGRGRGPVAAYMQLNGVHFLRADVVRHFDLATATDDGDESDSAMTRLPRLPDSKLDAWWRSIQHIADSLSQRQLLALARDNFPENSIARDRIRLLTSGRKQGPKPIGGKHSAQ